MNYYGLYKNINIEEVHDTDFITLQYMGVRKKLGMGDGGKPKKGRPHAKKGHIKFL